MRIRLRREGGAADVIAGAFVFAPNAGAVVLALNAPTKGIQGISVAPNAVKLLLLVVVFLLYHYKHKKTN